MDQAARQFPRVPLGVRLAFLLLALSMAYAALFTYMMWVSLQEQVFAFDPNPPRYAAPTHHHNAVEWVLIAIPIVAGWLGILVAVGYLAWRWARRT